MLILFTQVVPSRLSQLRERQYTFRDFILISVASDFFHFVHILHPRALSICSSFQIYRSPRDLLHLYSALQPQGLCLHKSTPCKYLSGSCRQFVEYLKTCHLNFLWDLGRFCLFLLSYFQIPKQIKVSYRCLPWSKPAELELFISISIYGVSVTLMFMLLISNTHLHWRWNHFVLTVTTFQVGVARFHIRRRDRRQP